MEKIGNAGWFITNEEHDKLTEVYELLKGLFGTSLTGGDGGTIPYNPQPIGINEPCPNCPWKNPNPGIGDWTWRPWQAPWYGNPGEPISPQKWKIGDGEWWKYQPYCTSTTADNSNAAKETKAFNAKTIDDQCK